jgi:hypothetical protein
MVKLLAKTVKGLAIGSAAVVLAAAGIDAADHYNNLSESLLGRLIAPEPEACPADMVFVPTPEGGFCLDRYEAAPSDDCPYDEVGSQSNTRDNLADADCMPVSEKGRTPWRFLSQSQALLACTKAGKRLPTAEEWYLGALGTPDQAGQDSCQLDSGWDTQPGFTGSGVACVSSYGAYDMAGNVWEWIRGQAIEGEWEGRELPESGYITAVDIQGLPVETRELDPDPNFGNDRFWHKRQGVRVLARGGYWQSGEGGGIYSAYLDAPPAFAGAGIGFRCVQAAHK